MPALALALSPTLDVQLLNHVANPSLRLQRITRFVAPSGSALRSDASSELRSDEGRVRFAAGGFRATVTARSGGFSADQPFFFDGSELAQFLDQLGRLERLEAGTARLHAIEGADVIGLQLHARGDVTVFGALHEGGRVPQVLRFSFTTDQTVVGPLRRDLSRCWSLPAF